MLPLRNGDLIGVAPSGWLATTICKILKAKTFHWAVVIGRDSGGYILSESLGKGTAVTRLRYAHYYAYRVRGCPAPTTGFLLGVHADNGDLEYDMQVNYLTGAWFLLKHYLKIVIPIVKNHTFNCQEWAVFLTLQWARSIIPRDDYPYCINLEQSPQLEFLGEHRETTP